MADIRINALATTAASTASDDFVAVDGSANGTRKLNAYSPTFGGNLTVSGTGTSSVGGAFNIGANCYVPNANYYRGKNAAGSSDYRLIGVTSGNVVSIDPDAAGATFGGNLTVSGTGTSSVAGTLNVSGGFILNRINAKGIYTGTSDNCGFTWTGTNGEFSTASGSLILKSAGTTALTLDSSQNATFAGTVKIANTAAINGVYTTTTTFDFGTIANNDASSVCTLTMTGVSSSDSIIVSPTDGDNFPQFCTVSAVPSGNSVSVRLYNGSGSSRTVGSRTIRVTAIKF